MKNYILVYIAIPVDAEQRTESEATYPAFLRKLGDLELQGAGSMRISENCWLLERKSDVSSLARIVSVAEGFRLGCGVRFLNED